MTAKTARMVLLACALALTGGIVAACSDDGKARRDPAGPSMECRGGYLGGGGGKTGQDTTCATPQGAQQDTTAS